MENRESANNCTLPQQVSPDAHYSVYKLTSPENKIYIGYTGEDPEVRWKKGYRGGAKRANRPIAAAIRNFGFENFRKEILCDRLTLEGAWKLEAFFIDFYDSMNPEKGYNRVTGGSPLGCRFGSAAREERSHSMFLRYANHPEAALVQKAAMEAYFTEHPEVKDGIRDRMKKRSLEGKNTRFLYASHRPRPVVCVETGEVYASQLEAERITGFKAIHMVCKGQRATAGGKHWKYA
ncbi:MAG: GIY-YIG nuclease family protein [Oscillospiraceae bacterium]|nr:GIY-YIG nuclease family protein [Oscillospiraceae bacterium]